jgi:hypothetical protein
VFSYLYFGGSSIHHILILKLFYKVFGQTKRLKQNPIITWAHIFGYGAIFNASCIKINNDIYVFARGVKEGYKRKDKKI